ncbi:MAG: hypothetical protein R2941_21820 [Desulfobacterales bacterium]
MRKKAEKKIRDAVAELGSPEHHRLDRIRPLAGLHPKVFDKTILDMERVGTIRLSAEGLELMNPSEISLLVRRGETVYVSFRFADGSFANGAFIDKSSPPLQPEPLRKEPEPVIVILQGLFPGEWEQFEQLCQSRESKSALVKMEEMIRMYNRQHQE